MSAHEIERLRGELERANNVIHELTHSDGQAGRLAKAVKKCTGAEAQVLELRRDNQALQEANEQLLKGNSSGLAAQKISDLQKQLDSARTTVAQLREEKASCFNTSAVIVKLKDRLEQNVLEIRDLQSKLEDTQVSLRKRPRIEESPSVNYNQTLASTTIRRLQNDLHEIQNKLFDAKKTEAELQDQLRRTVDAYALRLDQSRFKTYKLQELQPAIEELVRKYHRGEPCTIADIPDFYLTGAFCNQQHR
jgi:DNA repair exonuclease SbcCD ATPase subunit